MASSASATNISFLIFAASGFVGLLLFFIISIVYAYQRKSLQHKQKEHELQVEMKQKMLQALIEGQEKERGRLSRDIHDSLGAQLSTVKLYLAELRTHPLSSATEDIIQESMGLLTDSIRDLRAISQDLMPQPLQRLGLINTLRNYCHKLAVAHKIDIHFATNASTLYIPESTSLMIFRVIQEIINNAIKHGNSQTISVNLLDQVCELAINIEENGTPYNWAEARERSQQNGLGILNIETRVSIMNGTLHQTNVDEKNIVSIKIPMHGE
ncbi:sensor histidine kinase [Tunicatimonas pelagia]|uniref:sensor histidine kinase n=1 Tax=Tunicatimonas pelagia TaxID=931531 RepID=UPI002667014C|nr:histidine kinase [Tunicatimonas pelagia]WKN44582.1 histidine kinase [Tunicatimonas pelagia]